MKNLANINDSIPTFATKPSFSLLDGKLREALFEFSQMKTSLAQDYYTAVSINEMLDNEK